MRQGRVFKRCSVAGCRGAFRDKRCQKCAGTRGAWGFVVDVAPKGAPRDQRTRGGFETKAAALDAMAELQGDASTGGIVDSSAHTVESYLRQWLVTYRSQVKGTTYASAESHVRIYIVPALGSIPLQALDRGAVKAFYAELGRNGAARGRKIRDEDGNVVAIDRTLSQVTVHNVHLTLHRALGDAVDDKLLKANPVATSGRGKAAHKAPPLTEVTSWAAEELQVFLEVARPERLFALWRLAAYTGMRRGELCGLRWRHLDLDAATVTVVRQRLNGADGKIVEVEYGKSGRSRRTVDLDPETVQEMREYRSRYLEHRALLGLGRPALNDLVFVGEMGQPLHPDVATQQFDRIVVGLAGQVQRITLHGLRHTHATLMLAAGVPLHVVSRRIGHSSEAFTAQRYAHVLPQQGAAAAAAFAAAIRPADFREPAVSHGDPETAERPPKGPLRSSGGRI